MSDSPVSAPPVSLADQARAAHKEAQRKAAAQREAAQEATRANTEKDLYNHIRHVFGFVPDDVYITHPANDSDRSFAVIAGIPRATFTMWRGSGGWWGLYMRPVLDVDDDDPAFEEWWDNPANANRPRTREVQKLEDVGRTLAEWDDADWTIHPKPPKSDAPARKLRFAAREIDVLNEETRPFKVLGLGTDTRFTLEGTPYAVPVVIIEYTDIVLSRDQMPF